MEIIRAVILGIVQGFTEFIPISSDGHLVLIRSLLRWPDEGILFDATLHLGTFLALVIFFWPTWKKLFSVLLGKGTAEDKKLFLLLLVATIPGAIIGYLGEGILDKYFRGISIAGFGFMITAFVLFVSDKISAKGFNKKERPSYLQSIGIGFLQAFALLPGVSRSGSTIFGGIFSGLTKERAAEFSFLMAMPITGGAGLLALLKGVQTPDGSFWPLLVGFLFSFAVGYWAIKFFLKYISRKNFKSFVIYLVLIAIICFALSWIRK